MCVTSVAGVGLGLGVLGLLLLAEEARQRDRGKDADDQDDDEELDERKALSSSWNGCSVHGVWILPEGRANGRRQTQTEAGLRPASARLDIGSALTRPSRRSHQLVVPEPVQQRAVRGRSPGSFVIVNVLPLFESAVTL